MPAFRLYVVAILVGSLLLGCERKTAPSNYVARVGDLYLTQQQLTTSLEGLQMGRDTVEARKQIIEQWVTNALLYREAQRRNLSTDPAVQEQLREQRRAVLVNELTTRLYADFTPSITEDDVQAYFAQHREQMRIREPYVQVRYLATRTLDAAETVQSALRAASSGADSLDWPVLVNTHAVNADQARDIAARYYPESQLFAERPILRQQLERLNAGATSPILEIDGQYHVLHLIDRAAAGTPPRRAWVEDEIRRRLELRARKQMYAREVERLRNEARAREELEITP